MPFVQIRGMGRTEGGTPHVPPMRACLEKAQEGASKMPGLQIDAVERTAQNRSVSEMRTRVEHEKAENP